MSHFNFLFWNWLNDNFGPGLTFLAAQLEQFCVNSIWKKKQIWGRSLQSEKQTLKFLSKNFIDFRIVLFTFSNTKKISRGKNHKESFF